MKRQCFLIAATLFFGVGDISSAQEERLTTPQPEHKLLQRFEGEWDFQKTSPADDGSTPDMVGSGVIKGELLGRFFVIWKWSGDVYDTDFKAVQILGYDVNKKEYSGSWVDSIMSYRWQFNGSLETTSKALVVVASGPGADGDNSKFRERYHFNSADSITVIADMWQDEKWVTFMKTHITRRKKGKSD